MSQAANYALPVHSHFQEPDKTHTPEVKGTRCVLFWTTQVWATWRYNPSQIRSCHLFNYQFLIKFCSVFEHLLQAASPGNLAGEGCIYCWCMWCYFKQFHHQHTWKWLDRSLLTEQWFSALLGLQSIYSSQRRRGRLTYVRITFEISECPPFMYLKNYLL